MPGAEGSRRAKTPLQLSYAFQLLYSCSMTLVRLSILAFYRRLFPRESTPAWWRACLYSIASLALAYFIAGTAAAIFICTPISYFWTRTGKGHCINEILMFYISAALTVLADVLILLLPMPIIWRLQMQRSKKIGVMAIFLLGGL